MDLSLDFDILSASYRDLLVRNGDLVFTSDGAPGGTHYIYQDILQRLRTCLGEWFLNTTIGMPYYQLLFVKGARRADIDAAIQNIIVSTPGVLRLLSYQATYTTADRLVKVSFTCATSSGNVSYNGPLNTPDNQVIQ